jgi:protocatechuate 3,4-dioxygenase beta subunit
MDRPANRARRRVLEGFTLGVGFSLMSPLAKSANLLATPPQMRGPFYPLTLPDDKDNDLTTVTGRSGVAKGTITNVAGRVLDESGRPMRGVLVEIWQVNGYGRYHHPGDRQDKPLDPNFQGYGQFVTQEGGAYRFRTIKPIAYPGRAPHIHFALSGPDMQPFITQMYVEGAPENESDFLLQGIDDPKLRGLLIVSLEKVPGTEELTGSFDIVLAEGFVRRARPEDLRELLAARTGLRA